MYGQVSLRHYEGLNGFGMAPSQDVNELNKALEAGYQITNQTGGSALRVESLEASLKVVTFTNHHIKLWKKIPKSPAYSTVEEYNQLVSYGPNSFAFTQEGELPPSTDTSYARRTQLVKFMGTTAGRNLLKKMIANKIGTGRIAPIVGAASGQAQGEE